MPRKAFITFILFISASWNALAQEADTLTASKVYSARWRSASLPSESVVCQEGSVSGSINMADVVRNFTGIQIKDYGGAGGLKTINVRSLGSEHVGVFLDGIQIDNAQNMQVDLGRFSTEDIGYIQLYESTRAGQLQTAKEYVSGTALHMETQEPWFYGGRLLLRGGSFGTLNPFLRWSYPLGKRIALRVSANYLQSNGRYEYPCFDTTLVRENSDIQSLRLDAQIFGELRDGKWSIHLYSYGSDRGFPGPVIRRAVGFPFSAERQQDQNSFAQGGWTQYWSDRYSTALRFKYSDDYIHYDSHPEKNPMAMPADVKYRQQAGYISLAQSYILSDPWSVDLSTDYQYNSLDSDVGQFVRPRRGVLTTALASRLTWDRFRTAGHIAYMRAWDFFDSRNAGGWTRENAVRDAWMPSISVYYQPLKSLQLSAFAKKTWRLPSFNDLYYTLMGNSNLVPESAFQSGMEMQWHSYVKKFYLNFRLSPYYNQVDNKIVAIPTSSQFRWTMLNIGVADIYGAETKADVHYHAPKWQGGVCLRYTLQKALDHSTPGSQTWGNQIPYIPRHSASVIADFVLLGDLTIKWETSFTGGKWSRSANTPDYYIEPWSISSFYISKNVFDSVMAGFKLDNIFNKRYEIVQGYPMPGTSFMITLDYKW